jgi:hypothetical protein
VRTHAAERTVGAAWGGDYVIVGAGSAGRVLAVITRGNTHAPTVIAEKAASPIGPAAVGQP